MLCDADLLVFAEAVRRAIDVVDSGKAWLPISRGLDENGAPDSWLDFGAGVVGISRRAFDLTSGVPEFQSWGGEDDVFASRVGNIIPVVRERFDGIRHQWHPERCRHEHYQRPRQSDYHDYCAVVKLTESMPPGMLLKAFRASHPHWTGASLFLLLLSNGRMERPGVDKGGYEYEEEKYIVLNWDRWPAERLMWDENRKAYRNPATEFTLSPLAL
jgi:hypothetical protein